MATKKKQKQYGPLGHEKACDECLKGFSTKIKETREK